MKIYYFASLKEALKMPSEEIILSADMTVAQLRKKLVDKYGECHFPDNILCAVNQEIANDEVVVSDSKQNNKPSSAYPPISTICRLLILSITVLNSCFSGFLLIALTIIFLISSLVKSERTDQWLISPLPKVLMCVLLKPCPLAW
jgi:molybdopterin synthase sulfur carrier subunit